MPSADNTVIFINYRRSDAGWPAGYLYEKLQAAFGEDRVFLDVRNIDAGDEFTTEIKAQLERAAALIVLIGSSWARAQDGFGRIRLHQKNDWVRREIRRALKTTDCRVVPLLLDDAELPDKEDALPKDISKLLNRQSIRVRQASMEADTNALIKVLEKSGFRLLTRSLTSPRPDVRVKLNLGLGSRYDGAPQRFLSIMVENHSPLALFMGNIELRLKDGRLLHVQQDSVTGEYQKRRKLDPAESFTFNIATDVVAKKVNPKDLVCAVVTDDINRVYESDRFSEPLILGFFDDSAR